MLIIALAIAASLLAAASLRLGSLVSSLLAAYLALVSNLVLVVVALSPFRAVTRAGLVAAEAILLAAALAAWWLRGRPGCPLGRVGPALRAVAGEPVAAAFGVVTAVVLAYELVLCLTVPPNNWDALTYHLARAGAWAQHHGIHWIGYAPNDKLNEFQPVAEQELLFIFVATGTDALFALPQYLAQLALLVAVYGAARRLGFDARASACSAFLFATFSLVALESTTAQNDLVAASFAAVAACLLLGDRRAEVALAGAAAGIGLGVKLTTLLVWPVLLLLLRNRGRRTALVAAAGAAAGFVVVGMWGYVLNLAKTGRPLGYGVSRIDNTAWPSFPGSLHTGVHLVYRMLDLSVLSDALILWLAVAGVALGVAVGIRRYRQAGPRRGLLKGACVAAPLLAPVVVIAVGAVIAFLARIADIPVQGSGDTGGVNRTANEDHAAFGPVGAVLLLAVPVLTIVAYRARKADLRHLALALSVPVFLVLLALQATYNPYLTRFLLVPAALTAPLFARFFRGRVASLTLAGVATLVVALTLAHDRMKPLDSVYGRPWQLTQGEAIRLNWKPDAGGAVDAYRKLMPADACVGAVVGPDEPSYLVFGPRLDHRVFYLPVFDAVAAAHSKTLFYVVISDGPGRPTVGDFRNAGWKIEPLGDYWLLAVSPARGAATGDCFA